MGKGCIELMQGREQESASPPREAAASPSGENKSKARNGKGKKDVRLRKDSSVECSGCGRWVNASDADVDGVLMSEVSKMEVFCLRCVYGVISELRAELRESRDEVSALREAQVCSSSEVKEFMAERCKCKCKCRTEEGVEETREVLSPQSVRNEVLVRNPNQPEVELSVASPVAQHGEQQPGVGAQKRACSPTSSVAQHPQNDGFINVQRKKR